MWKLLSTIGALIIIGSAGYLLFFTTTLEPMASCSDTAPKIVAFGDSLVYGYGATKGNNFVSVLSTSIGVPITNLGVNGDTTASALERIDAVADTNPDIVIVLLGGNDALRRVPVSETEENLNSIISTLKQEGNEVILVGVIGGFPSDPFKPMFQRLSETHGVEYVPNVLSGIIGTTNFMSDEIHPNDAGYAKIAAKIQPALEQVCAKNTQ